MRANKATNLLTQSFHGNHSATDELAGMLSDQLREIAARHLRSERKDHTLQPTALVNEAYLKLFDQSEVEWQNTNHFRAIASNVMRRILVDHARARMAKKRGGQLQRVCLDGTVLANNDDPLDVTIVNDLIDRLGQLNQRHAQVVELRVFGGLGTREIAEQLNVSMATVKNDWRCSRAWLMSQMESL